MSNAKDNIYTEDRNEVGESVDNIEIGFDEESFNYYAVLKLIALGLGKTREEALNDLSEAGHFGLDTIVNLKADPAKQQIKVYD